MSKKSGTLETAQPEGRQKAYSREEIEMALAQLQRLAESLPPVDVVAIVRDGRNARPNN